MVIKVGNPGVSELGAAICQRAIEVGYLKSKVLECQKAFILNPSDESVLNSLDKIFSLTKEQEKECKTLHWQISTLPDASRSFLKKQSKMIQGALDYSEETTLELVQSVFDTQCYNVETRLKEIIEKLNVFRTSPSDAKFHEMEKASLSFFSRIKKIEEFGSQCPAFSEADQKRVDALKEECIRLADIIDFQNPRQFSYLFASLKACANLNQIDPALLQQLDEKIDSMPKEFVSQLDAMLCEHAGQSVNDNFWDKSRRYEDVKFFIHALKTTMIQEYERRILKVVSQDELHGIYQKVFTRASGPAGENYEHWVKSEFPSLIHLIEEAYHERILKSTHYLDQVKSFPSESSRNKSSPERAPSLPYDLMLVNGSMTKENIIRHAHAPESEKNRLLYSLLDKIDLIEEISKRRFTSINQSAIKRAIAETLPEDLCFSLFGMISFISPTQRSGPGWGQRHCTTEIPRLRRAIYNLLY